MRRVLILMLLLSSLAFGQATKMGPISTSNFNDYRFAYPVAGGIQMAITDLGGPGIVYLPNSNAGASTTITVPSGVSLIGRGSRTSITWTGAAGQPVIKVQDASNTVIRDVRIYGNTSNVPSAAIEYNQGGGNTLYGNFASNVYIGDDSNSSIQFTTGILFSGTVNGHFGSLRDIRIFKATTGVDIQNSNASDIEFSTLFVTGCVTGFKTKAKIVGKNWLFTSNTGTDLQLEVGGRINVDHFVSESSKRMAVFNGAAARLMIRGGSYQASTYMDNVDGRFIDMANFNDSLVDLEDFDVFYVSPPIAPKIRMGTGAGTPPMTLRLENTSGIYPANFEIPAIIVSSDRRRLIYHPHQNSGQDILPYFDGVLDFTKSANRSYRSWSDGKAGEFNLYGGPLNVNKLPVPTAVTVTPTGGAATTWNYKITALTYDGGETDLSTAGTTAAGAASLDSTHYNTITWMPSQGAYSYNVYRDVGGGVYNKLATVTWDSLHNGLTVATPRYVDNGSASPSGAAPTVNTTGNATIEGGLTVGGALSLGSPLTFPSGQTYGPTATGSALNSGSTPQVQNGSWGYTEIKGNTGAGDACLKLPRVGAGSNNLATSWVCNSYNGNFSGGITFWSAKKTDIALNPNDAIKSATFWVDNSNTYSHLDLTGGLRVNQAASAKPTCNSNIRGMFWYTAGAAGVKDAVEVCAKDAADAYAWRTIY